MANTSTGQGGHLRGRYRLSLLCLDKRSGSLLHIDDKIRMDPDQNTGTAELSISDAVNSTVAMRILQATNGGNIQKSCFTLLGLLRKILSLFVPKKSRWYTQIS